MKQLTNTTLNIFILSFIMMFSHRSASSYTYGTENMYIEPRLLAHIKELELDETIKNAYASDTQIISTQSSETHYAKGFYAGAEWVIGYLNSFVPSSNPTTHLFNYNKANNWYLPMCFMKQQVIDKLLSILTGSDLSDTIEKSYDSQKNCLDTSDLYKCYEKGFLRGTGFILSKLQTRIAIPKVRTFKNDQQIFLKAFQIFSKTFQNSQKPYNQQRTFTTQPRVPQRAVITKAAQPQQSIITKTSVKPQNGIIIKSSASTSKPQPTIMNAAHNVAQSLKKLVTEL